MVQGEGDNKRSCLPYIVLYTWLSVGCRFILYHRFTRTSKTDNSNNSHAFFFNIACLFGNLG